METVLKENLKNIFNELFLEPELKDISSIIKLTGNELASISLNLSTLIKTIKSIDLLFEEAIKLLGKNGIAERILLFQISKDKTKAFLTNYWESPYVDNRNPIGIEINVAGMPIIKLFASEKKPSFQLEDVSKYIGLPGYLFNNKIKALILKLKCKSMLFSFASSEDTSIVLSFQFCTRNIVWSNEIEKAIQSFVSHLAVAAQGLLIQKKKENLQKNIVLLKETAIREQEELLSKFASDVHDLPCTIIPRLRQAISETNLKECEQLVDELHLSLRQLINEYVIPDIKLLGFVNTIFQFINGFKKGFKGKVIIDVPDEEINIPDNKSMELFKVIREWMCNIQKHAKAEKVSFNMRKQGDSCISISISDDGIGFNPDDLDSIGYGIANMKKRLENIKAKFEIKSKEGEGSSIKIQIGL